MTATEKLMEALDSYIDAKVAEKLYAHDAGEQGVSYALDKHHARDDLQVALVAWRAVGSEES